LVEFSADPFERLSQIMARLRAPDGCPWDKKQTHQSLMPYLIEESYELWDAIEQDNGPHMLEELGDVLLQVVFHAQLASEKQRFDFRRIATQLADKLIARHPHVFGDGEKLQSPSEVVESWEAIKRKESDKLQRTSALDGVPRFLPALLKAQKVQKKAAKVGFDWQELPPVEQKVHEEHEELSAAIASGDAGHIQEELGDMLFSLVNLSRHLGISAEEALNKATEKFELRFRGVERLVKKQGETLSELSLQQLDRYWDEVKKK